MSKRNLIIIIIVLVLAAAVAIGFFVSRRGASPVADQTPPGMDPKVYQVQKELGQIAEKATQAQFAIDHDFDGILDVDEAKYGTSSTSSDTDQDGLLDNTEINTFKTDPLKADTDKDGHKDGEEVFGGYNPLGPGKLTASTTSF